MTEKKKEVSIAEQLLAIETLFGRSEFLPTERNPLPEMELGSSPAGETEGEIQHTARDSDSLEEIAAEIADCRKCILCKKRTNTVPGEGNGDADIVFVGEGPGADEDASGRPFVGRAGQLLTKMIMAMGLSRDDVFICNMVKCRPPGNRTPAPDEIQACWDYLSRQLAMIRPRVIITLGNPSTKGLLNTSTGITRMRGTWQKMGEMIPAVAGTPVMPTFHPSYVLRRYTPETRGMVWSDLQSVMDFLGLEIPEG